MNLKSVSAAAAAFAFLALAAPGAQAQPGPWQQLGCRSVAFHVDRDVIPVGPRTGVYRAIRLRVMGAPIEMLDLKVVYGNGMVDDLPVRALIPAGGETRAIDLRGGGRFIRRIDLVYRSIPTFRGRATVCAEGLVALAGPVAPAAPLVQRLRIRELAKEIRIELPGDILFDFDKSDIRPSAEATLLEAAELLRRRAVGRVVIEGHTNSKGTPAYNQTLSERRAFAVQQWLIERAGARNVTFAIEALAATRPAAPNTKPDGTDNPEGRQLNRRVEIVFGRR